MAHVVTTPVRRGRLASGVAGLIALLASCTGISGEPPASTPGSPSHADAVRSSWPTIADVTPSASFSAEGLAALDAKMKEAVDKNEVAGMQYILIKDGKVAAFRSLGHQSLGGPPITEDTLFRIMSMTKPVTGVALMQLYEKGLWKLDDPISKFYPEFGNLMVAAGEDPVTKQPILVKPDHIPTMRELFTHTAGFGYGLSASSAVDRMFIADPPEYQKDMNALVKRVAEIPLLAQPGTRWSYSIAIDVQGAIVEKLSGMTFGEYLKTHLFAPLGMHDTTFFLTEDKRPRLASVYARNAQTGTLDYAPDDPRFDFFKRDHAESGGGGLVSTTHDYARFVQMLLNKGTLDGRQVLKAETVDMMFTDHVPAGISNRWGLGGQLSGPPSDRSPHPENTFSWFGIQGTWFWADATNSLGFVGMIQRNGNGGADAVNLRSESAAAVYKALKQ